jgi:hypothetical protein
MSGGGGHVIINSVNISLSDPLIHGALPAHMQPALDNALAKDPGALTNEDKNVLAAAVTWAILNLT